MTDIEQKIHQELCKLLIDCCRPIVCSYEECRRKPCKEVADCSKAILAALQPTEEELDCNDCSMYSHSKWCDVTCGQITKLLEDSGLKFTKHPMAKLFPKAQLDHDKGRMVKLPSDMEKFRKSVGYIIVRHIFLNEDSEACLDDYDIAQELLKLLKGEQHAL